MCLFCLNKNVLEMIWSRHLPQVTEENKERSPKLGVPAKTRTWNLQNADQKQ
jgi:hypothetical protein